MILTATPQAVREFDALPTAVMRQRAQKTLLAFARRDPNTLSQIKRIAASGNNNKEFSLRISGKYRIRFAWRDNGAAELHGFKSRGDKMCYVTR